MHKRGARGRSGPSSHDRYCRSHLRVRAHQEKIRVQLNHRRAGATRKRMCPDKNNEPIKITLDDLAHVATTAPTGAATTPGRGPGDAKVYGSVGEAADQRVETHEERGSILLQAWFYLGMAGLLGASLAWALAEPGVRNSSARHSRNKWLRSHGERPQ